MKTRFIGQYRGLKNFNAKRQKSLFGFLRSFSSEKDLKPRGSDWSEAPPAGGTVSKLKFGLFFLAVIDFFSVKDGDSEEAHNGADDEGYCYADGNIQGVIAEGKIGRSEHFA